jgi:hypothetical protein
LAAVIPNGPAPELPDPDFWSVRPRRSRARRRTFGTRVAGRARTVAALGLVGALAVAWVVTSHHASPRALAHEIATDPQVSAVAARVPIPTAAAGTDGALLRALAPAGARCVERSGAAATRCSIARVDVDYRLMATGSLRSAYLAAVLPGFAGGSASLASGSGPPACARGAEDERAWSRPAAPPRAVGRYACRIEQGRAAMWWTVDDRGLLAHATATDGDLASLFEWWESHSER